MAPLRFDGRVIVITGAGNGLGRSHALSLATLGASVVVNDLGTSVGGDLTGAPAAQIVADEIRAAGGIAVANADSVEDGARIVQCALDHFGRIDALINNAGILRDRSFARISDEEWDAVYRTHVLGSFRCTRAAWPYLIAQKFGRVVFTTSGSGLYGNYGQANYAMAKLGIVGLAHTLAIEGRAKNVAANCVAPVAGSRMPSDLWPREVLEAVRPEFVTHLVAYLCHERCAESGGIFEAGGGYMARLRWNRSAGAHFPSAGGWGIDDVAAQIERISDFSCGDFPSSIADTFEPLLSNLPPEVAAIWRRRMVAARDEPRPASRMG